MPLKLEMRSQNIDWYCRHNRFPDFHLTAFPWCGLTEDIEAWKTLVGSFTSSSFWIFWIVGHFCLWTSKYCHAAHQNLGQRSNKVIICFLDLQPEVLGLCLMAWFLVNCFGDFYEAYKYASWSGFSEWTVCYRFHRWNAFLLCEQLYVFEGGDLTI